MSILHSGFILITSLVLSCGCSGRYPAELRTKQDIAKTPADWYAISIGGLPLSLYPELRKFREVEHVFFKPQGGATDEKLKALADVPMPRLRDIVLGGSSDVTDEGVLALVRFPALELLQLTGTSISDRVVDGLARFPKLAGLNVMECRGLTKEGLERLVRQRPWQDLGFSAENLSTEEVAELLQELPKHAYCSIEDKAVHLDEVALQKIADERGIILNLRKNRLHPGYR